MFSAATVTMRQMSSMAWPSHRCVESSSSAKRVRRWAEARRSCRCEDAGTLCLLVQQGPQVRQFPGKEHSLIPGQCVHRLCLKPPVPLVDRPTAGDYQPRWALVG